MAVISYMIGLSLALGAFFAGLIVSESEYNYQILAGMVPFKDTFICIFFVSIGMLLDPRFLINNPAQVLVLLIVILIGKFMITTLATSLAQYPLKTSILVGAGLAHIGPFSFVLVKMGLQYNLLSEHVYNLSLTASLLTMMITPFIIRMSPRLITGLSQFPLWDRWLRGKDDQELTAAGTQMKNHIVICGYGPIGIMLGRVLNAKKIPFVALELNAATVIKMKNLGINCYYGDATSPEVLKKVNIEKARIVVATTPDAMSSEAIVKNVKSVNPDCYIIARSRFSKELEELYDFGADSVIQEEFETGLSILVRVLKELKIKIGDIKKEVETIKVERDELTKAHYFGPMTLSKQISARRVVLDLTSRTKEEAIRELIGAVSSSRKIRNAEELIERVLEREEIEVTGIGDGIAIPHARTNAIDGIFVGIGISKKGIEYGALDGKPVNIMILLGANESAHEQYLNALASVATFFKDAKFRQDIIKCTEPSHVIHLLKEREQAYSRLTA